jgi:hypothetical protein
MRTILTTIGVLFAFATSAEARPHHHGYRHFAHHHYRHFAHRHYRQEAEGTGYASFGSGFGFENTGNVGYRRSRHANHRLTSYRSARVAGRPAAWCGWYMRQQVGADPGPEYNLARSWARYGSNAGGPSVGTIVVWRHHVGRIVGQVNGQWIVESGNDGHAVRTRPRSLAGAIAFRRAMASM